MAKLGYTEIFGNLDLKNNEVKNVLKLISDEISVNTGTITTLNSTTITGTTINADTITEGGTALSAKYLGISAKAADSELLDGHDSTYFAVAGHTHTTGDVTDFVNNYLTGVSGSGNGTVIFTRQGLADLTWDSSHTHGTGEITGYSDTYLSNVAGSGNGSVTFTLNDSSTILWDASHIHSQYLTSEIHLSSVSGSGNGTVTFTMSDTSTITWDSSHTHSEYSLTSHNHDSAYVNVTGDTMTGDLKLGENALVIDGTGRRISGSGIELYGVTSSAFLSTEDGNGRIQLKWNATRGTGETYLVTNEPAGKWEFDPLSSGAELFTIDYGSGSATANDTITWESILKVGTSTFTYKNNIIWHGGNFDPASKQDALGYTPENVVNKGQPNGYASLDANGLVPTTQIPSSYKEIKVVADIATRDAISSPFEGLRVHVIDASADATVTSGWAEYLYTGSSWTKTAESESIDVVVDWSNVQNKPTYDNYDHWNLKVNSESTGAQVGSDGTVDFVAGSNVTITRTGGVVTISSSYTDTNTWRPVHDTPTDGATTTSISSNWAYDHSNYVASTSLGHIKSGGDITVAADGTVSVNDDSHNHIISNIDGLQTALDGKSDTGHTHAYLPLSGGTMSGSINMGNNSITNLDSIQIGDPGADGRIQWVGGNDWKIYESPDDLVTNTGGNLQIVRGSTRVATFRTDNKMDVPGGFKTNKFSLEYNATEDSLDIVYTA